MQGYLVDTNHNDAVAVTPSDTVVFSPPLRGIWVGGAGALAVTTQDGTVVTFAAVPAGTLVPIAASKVMSTNTVATNIVGFK